MNKIQTRYITKDEFKEYSGIDLDATLRDDGNPSNKTNAFLSRIERRVATYLNAHFFRNVDIVYIPYKTSIYFLFEIVIS